MNGEYVPLLPPFSRNLSSLRHIAFSMPQAPADSYQLCEWEPKVKYEKAPVRSVFGTRTSQIWSRILVWATIFDFLRGGAAHSRARISLWPPIAAGKRVSPHSSGHSSLRHSDLFVQRLNVSAAAVLNNVAMRAGGGEKVHNWTEILTCILARARVPDPDGGDLSRGG